MLFSASHYYYIFFFLCFVSLVCVVCVFVEEEGVVEVTIKTNLSKLCFLVQCADGVVGEAGYVAGRREVCLYFLFSFCVSQTKLNYYWCFSYYGT